jgi:hypothetical protein
MPYILIFIAGVAATLLVQLAWLLYSAVHGQAGPLRVTAVIVDHRVGPGTTHAHSYSPLLPGFILNWRSTRDAKRCIYTKLELSVDEVWDAEVEHIARERLDAHTVGRLNAVWGEAEALILDEYNFGAGPVGTILSRGPGIESVARAQLARRDAVAA